MRATLWDARSREEPGKVKGHGRLFPWSRGQMEGTSVRPSARPERLALTRDRVNTRSSTINNTLSVSQVAFCPSLW